MNNINDNTNEIKLSVVVIFYNQEQYVRQTMESILAQKTDFNYEILMGDDKSSDKTPEILKEYENKYPDKCRFFELPKEEDKKFEILERQTDNRIYLIPFTRGEYINFIDGDDFFTGTDKFKRQVEALDNHPECNACFHRFSYYWDKDGTETLFGDLGNEEKIIPYEKYWRRYYIHSAAFIYRNIYVNNVKELKGKIFDDNIITLWHLQMKDIYYIPENWFSYRQLENSTWNKITDIDRELINIKACEDCVDICAQLKNGLTWQTYLRFRKSYEYVFKHRNELTEIRFLKKDIMMEVLQLYQSDILRKTSGIK